MIEFKHPSEFLDEEEYPTEKWLNYIRNFDVNTQSVTEFIVRYLKAGWKYPNWGVRINVNGDGISFELHTGGWSGCEEVIYEMRENEKLWKTLGLVDKEPGGHYYFEYKYKN